MKENNEIGEIFRNTFKDFQKEPSPDVWNNIKNNAIPKSYGKFNFSNSNSILKIVAGLAVTTVIVYVAIQLFNNEPEQIVTQKENITQNNTEQNIVSENNQEKISTAEITNETNNDDLEKIPEQKVINNSKTKDAIESLSNQIDNVQDSEKDDNQIITKENAKVKEIKQQGKILVNQNHSKQSDITSPIEIIGNPNIDNKPTEKQTIIIESNKTICFGEDAILTASKGDFYLWNTGSNSKTITVVPVRPTTYNVTTTDNNGAIWIENITVNIDRECTSIFVPNAFSPNNDGNNDEFKVFGTNIKKFNIKIFSKRGVLVFETNNIDIGWDGKTNNQNTKSEVYISQINYVDGLNNPHKKIGQLTLIK